MNHPLTHEQCELLSCQPWLDPDVDVEGTIHDMRAAADWQLEADAHWWKIILKGADFLPPAELDHVIEEFKAAMRPAVPYQVIEGFKAAMRPQDDN